MNNKKANMGIGALISFAIMIVVLGVTLGLGGTLTSDIGTGATAGSALDNATNDAGAAIDRVSGYQGTLATIVIIVVLLGLLSSLAYMKFVRG